MNDAHSNTDGRHILVSGSLSYDRIVGTDATFSACTIGDNPHNMVITVQNARQEFGGCAGNIAYTLRLLGLEPVILASAGDDFESYRNHLLALEISDAAIRIIPNCLTASATIISDCEQNQITAFHPGAMASNPPPCLPSSPSLSLAIVAPDDKYAMLAHCEALHKRGVRFMLDPGQGLALFNREELLYMIDQASWLVLNQHEADLLKRITGISADRLLDRLKCVVTTYGKEGARFMLPQRSFNVSALSARTVDPTGCGDAFRAGLLYGLIHGLDWERSAHIASVCGAFAVEHVGTQNHCWTPQDFELRMKASKTHIGP